MHESSDGLMFKTTKRKITEETLSDSSPAKMAANFSKNSRGLFKDYNHIYTEDGKSEYPVLLSPLLTTGKLDLLTTNSTLKNIPGVSHIKQVGSALQKVFFKDKLSANKFLLNKALNEDNGWVARIPFDHLEVQGIIKAPTQLTEEDLLTHLKASSEIIGVKRFMRKTVDGSSTATATVLLTFLNTVLPDHVTYDHIWFDTSPYIKPLRQCFVCYKFDHSRTSCKAKQVCSICSGNHFFKDCPDNLNPKCINCKGPHPAVSVDCPVKAAKISAIKAQINGKATYASIASKKSQSIPAPDIVNPKSFPSLPQRRALISDILNSDVILNALTKTVLDIIQKRESKNKEDAIPITSKSIKELLISNFAS